ncbi:MAG: DNA recombination protein RmuC [Candidatus Thermoplasmatota archaeon]|jgi:DNA recombination protein RmuC|nr:DNA recombination protein RmuC [Candidatus Thermoplasmatota archaeon]
MLLTFFYGFILGGVVFVPLSFLISQKLLEKSHEKNSNSAKSIALEIIRETGAESESVSRLLAQNVSATTETIMERKEAEIGSMIKPLSDSISTFQRKVEEMERSRIEDTTGIRKMIEEMSEMNQRVSSEAQHLNSILRNSMNRGKWGEMTLRRVVEITGMRPRVDFDEQVTMEKAVRPDMVVHLPGNREIIIDSKAPYKKYLEYTETDDESTAGKLLREFSNDLRDHIRALGGKNYSSYLTSSADFVVLFLPEESMISAAFAGDPEIFEYGVSQNVIICTPMTLIGLLRVVNSGWQERTIMENSKNILSLARELHDRLKIMTEKIGDLGKSIDTAAKSYNSMLSSIESRIMPTIRKLENMGSMKGVEQDFKQPDEVVSLREDRWN